MKPHCKMARKHCCPCASPQHSCKNCVCVRQGMPCQSCRNRSTGGCKNQGKDNEVRKEMPQEKLISVDSDIANQLTVSAVERDSNCYFRCKALAIHGNENRHKEVRQKIVETMKMNKQVYQAHAENFDSHLENMVRSDGHSNTWATEAEILATSEAYKCDVFFLREQYINTGWRITTCSHLHKAPQLR